MLTAKSLSGAVTWLGEPLLGDGRTGSRLFQVIAAGANAVADAPTEVGGVGGDDQLLYGVSDGAGFGYFGEGAGVVPDLGRFSKVLSHDLPVGSRVYVRGWEGGSFYDSVAYGNSALRTTDGSASQTIDFGTWTVGTPVMYGRDSNGDSIADAASIGILFEAIDGTLVGVAP